MRLLAHQHSRYPIVSADQEAVGILLQKMFSQKPQQSSITQLIRNVTYISENERINQVY